jgi:hypothetical protein
MAAPIMPLCHLSLLCHPERKRRISPRNEFVGWRLAPPSMLSFRARSTTLRACPEEFEGVNSAEESVWNLKISHHEEREGPLRSTKITKNHKKPQIPKK